MIQQFGSKIDDFQRGWHPLARRIRDHLHADILPPYPTQPLRDGLFQPQHDRRAQDGLGVLGNLLRVTKGDPQRLGGPDGVIDAQSALLKLSRYVD